MDKDNVQVQQVNSKETKLMISQVKQINVQIVGLIHIYYQKIGYLESTVPYSRSHFHH